jgi:hypothetical protein
VVEDQEIQEDAADLRGFAQQVTFLRLIPQAPAVAETEKSVSVGE